MDGYEELDDFGEGLVDYVESEDDDDDDLGTESLQEALAEAEDDDDDDDDVGESFDAEFLDPISLGLGAVAARKYLRGRKRKRRRIRRASVPKSYTRRVRGKQYGVIQTPRGRARIKLPGRFPTTREFRNSVRMIQRDVKKNSAGIKDLTVGQKKDIARLASVIKKATVATDKKITTMRWAITLLAVGIPTATWLARSQSTE